MRAQSLASFFLNSLLTIPCFAKEEKDYEGLRYWITIPDY